MRETRLVRRSRILAFCFVLLVLLTIVSPVGRASAESKELSEIFMSVGATRSSIRAVRAALDDSPLVKSYRFLDKDAAYRELQRIFRNDPDLISNLDPALLPASFRVQLNPGAHMGRFKRAFERMAQVDSVELPASIDIDALASMCDQTRDPARTEVFMQVTASTTAIETVRAELDNSPLVKRYVFVDKNAAFEEFKRIFRKDPDLIKIVTPSLLPVSFRVQLQPGADSNQFDRTFDAMAEVDAVNQPMNPGLARALEQVCGTTATTMTRPSGSS